MMQHVKATVGIKQEVKLLQTQHRPADTSRDYHKTALDFLNFFFYQA